MEINNPQSFDHIIGLNGEILAPKVLNIGEIETDKITNVPIIWRKTTADEYHVPVRFLAATGGVIEVVKMRHRDLNPTKVSGDVGIIHYSATDIYLLPPGIVEANGAMMNAKVIEIGPWDMETNQTKIVGHGLTFTNIRSVQVMILRDDSSALYPLNMPDPIAVVSMQGGVSLIDTNTISLMRDTDGYFDHIDFNDGVMNRGFITIWYQA